MNSPLQAYLLPRSRQKIEAALRQAVHHAVDREELPEAVLEWVAAPGSIKVEIPADRNHGDFASSLALTLARPTQKAPRVIAEVLAELLTEMFEREEPAVRRVEVAGPGFLNVFMDEDWLPQVIGEVLSMGERYGSNSLGQGEAVLIEFVSANPTGPLNVVNSRAAAYGDALASVMAFSGYRVHREFYVNDQGNQFLQLGRAMETRLRQLCGQQAELPEGAYPGEYIIDIAQEYLDQHGSDILQAEEPLRLETLARFAVERIRSQQEETLANYGVRFDRWYRESEVRRSSLPQKVLRIFEEKGMTYEAEGALWLKTQQFGDDKDRVLVRQNGEYTYFMPDIAYHLGKLERGYQRLIDLFGQDHHGYVPRLQAALQALGCRPDQLEVLITQMVRLIRNGQAVRMSKRGGNFISMDEFLEETGKDAARFFFLSRTLDSHMDFDLDLARLQSNENPVYYVQYAHARICSILEQAASQGMLGKKSRTINDKAHLRLLVENEERDLLLHLAVWPGEVMRAAADREAHRISHYLRELATYFHAFYARCRVLGDDPRLTAARLDLISACRQVLANGLTLLGVSAPEQM